MKSPIPYVPDMHSSVEQGGSEDPDAMELTSGGQRGWSEWGIERTASTTAKGGSVQVSELDYRLTGHVMLRI